MTTTLMRKLIVTNIISVDGFYSGPKDDVIAMPFDATFQRPQPRATPRGRYSAPRQLVLARYAAADQP